MAMNSEPPVKTDLLSFIRNSSGAEFIIPVYQRNYTWVATKQVKQLMDDLESVIAGKCKKHFMGIMIYLNIDINYYTKQYSIIDGQQRLVTLFLLLYAIRKKFEALKENEKADDIKSLYFYANPNANNRNDKLKLKPQVSDDDVYQKIITDRFIDINATEKKKSNVYKSYEYIYKRINSSSYTCDEYMSALEKLYIVCIPVTTDDYPQKIFESINATGVSLTASDLIRNLILMDKDDEEQEKYYKKWIQIEKYISTEPKKLESFFRMFIAAKNRDLPDKDEIYEKFSDWYNNENQTRDVDAILNDILNYARYYNVLYIAKYDEVDDELSNSIEEFSTMRSDMPGSLFMELYSMTEQYDNDAKPLVSKRQLNDIIKLTTIYLIRRSLCDMGTSTITRMFPQILRELLNECNGDYSDIVEKYKVILVDWNKGSSMEMPDNTKMYKSVINKNMYVNKTTRIFLNKLVRYYDNKTIVGSAALSIEHLMPQTGTDGWYKELNVTEEEYNSNVQRLGNLTLVTKADNSSMGNMTWEEKKKILSGTTVLKMNEELLKKEKWTIKDIDDRTEEMIKQINILYPYFE